MAPRVIHEFVYMCKTLGVDETSNHAEVCTPGKVALNDRPLLDEGGADALAGMFAVLAGGTRVRLLHALAREGELCVSDLAEQVGMRPAAVCNQLARLEDRRIVAARREGNRVFYRINDPCLPQLLHLGWCLLEESGDPAARPLAAVTAR